MKNSTEQEINLFIEKTKKFEKGEKLDLSSGEDLSIGIMNLISIEEHFFFTGAKTGKDEYFDLLNTAREMRKELLKKIIKDYEGEVWCASKHLLSASMRMMEVGTKYLKDGKEKEAKEYFDKSYNLYNLFWALNLNMINTKTMKDKGIISSETLKKVRQEEEGIYEKEDKSNINLNDKSFFSKIGDLVKKAIDCCKE